MRAEALMRLIAAAESWSGTPFHPHARLKNVGVDCVQLAVALYAEAGLISRDVPLPAYRLDAAEYLDRSLVLDWLRSRPELVAATPPWQPADVLTFRVPGVPHHVGILLRDDEFCHVLRHDRVRCSRLSDPTWSRRLGPVFRHRLFAGV